MSYSRVRSRGSSRPGPARVLTLPSCDAVDLKPVATALAELEDGELCALIDVTNNVPQTVPGLFAWIGHACDWELNRRAGVDLPLHPPGAAIPPNEDAASTVAAMRLRARFNQNDGRDAGTVVAFFDAVIRVLPGRGRWH
jgi:hypothetical protein